MDSHPLDAATALEGDPAAPLRTGRTSDRYWTFISPFGGTSAATALRAVLEHPGRRGDPLAVTVNFCAPIAAGDFGVRLRRVRDNKSSQHWQVEFEQASAEGGEAQVVLTASVVTALRRESWHHQPGAMPPLPPPASLATYAPAKSLGWVKQYEIRFADGEPLLDEPDAPVGTDRLEAPACARSVLWIRDAVPRPLDFVSLMALSDAFFGRIFQVIRRIPPFGTVTMTTHFHASADELAAIGTVPIAGVADARVFHRGFGDQTVELYGAEGALLATSTQMAFFRV